MDFIINSIIKIKSEFIVFIKIDYFKVIKSIKFIEVINYLMRFSYFINFIKLKINFISFIVINFIIAIIVRIALFIKLALYYVNRAWGIVKIKKEACF